MICLLNNGKGGKEDRRGKKKAIIWFGNAKKNGVTEAQSELFISIILYDTYFGPNIRAIKAEVKIGCPNLFTVARGSDFAHACAKSELGG